MSATTEERPAPPEEVVDGRPSPVKRAVTMISPWIFAAVVLVALALPRLMGEGFFAWGYALIVTATYVLFATSWDIVSGYTGQVNFGHSAFIGIGGFTAAIAAQRADLDLWLVILLATVVAAVLGVVIGIPALRLTGPYLALVTLTVVTALIQIQLSLKEYTGGEEGVVGLPRLIEDPVLGPIGAALAKLMIGPATYEDGRTLDQDLYVDYALVIVITAIVVAGLLLLGYSKRGLVLRSIQQDPMAAEAAGVPIARYKVLAFILSGALGGFAGGLAVAIRGNANLDLLAVTLSLLIIVMAALGGVGTIVGPALGAVIVGLLDQKLLAEIDYVNRNLELKLGVFALILIIVVLVQPKGLLPPVQKWWRGRLAGRNKKEIGAGLSSLGVVPGAGGEGDAARTSGEHPEREQAAEVERG